MQIEMNNSKFVFIDRDGVINRDPQEKLYVTSWSDFEFLPGALDALRDLTNKGYKIVIVSNQAGVGRGIYSKETLDEITAKMLGEIGLSGGRIHSAQYCIHKKEDNCDCRKPKTGLFKMAAEGLQIDYKKTYFIGDSETDVAAGKAIGCKTILVLSGKTKNKGEASGWPLKPDFIVDDLKSAVSIIEGGRFEKDTDHLCDCR